MVITELVAELDCLGVRLKASRGRLMTLAPVGSITPDLGAALKEHKPALVGVLGLAAPPDFIPLPDPLARLALAAASDQMPTSPIALEGGGFITKPVDYVLAWAATYATGGDTKHALERLWAIYRARESRQ